jgi:hypothetical protein
VMAAILLPSSGFGLWAILEYLATTHAGAP